MISLKLVFLITPTFLKFSSVKWIIYYTETDGINNFMYITNFRPDEFGRKSKEPYLKPRESTNILNSMLIDESSRITVAKLFIESLKVKGNQIILTAFHLDWAMECVGYAFSMPISEISTIKQALKLYTDWLTLPDSVPNVMKCNFEYYQKEILGHFSLIFYKRDDLIKQAELSNEILRR